MEKITIPDPEVLLSPLVDMVNRYIQRGLLQDAKTRKQPDITSDFHREISRVRRGLVRMRLLEGQSYREAVCATQLRLMDLTDAVTAAVGAQEIAEAQRLLGPYRYSTANTLFQGFTALLQYLRYYCADQFDHTMPVSEGQREVWTLLLHDQMAALDRWFNEQHLSQELWDIVTYPYCEIIVPEMMPLLTDRRWRYLSALWDELERLTRCVKVNGEEALLRLLFRFNFNNSHYAEYVMNYIAGELSCEDLSDAQRSARARYYRHIIVSTTPKKNRAWSPEEEGLRDRLLPWLEGEPELYLMLRQSSAETKPDRKLPRDKDRPHKQRLGVTPSTTELAGFVRVLAECNIIAEENHSEIVRHVAYGFSTPGTDTPKVKHIREDFDELNEPAYRFIEDTCKKMCHLVADLRSGKRTLKKSRKNQ
jgi:hypothetical protein